MGSASLKNCFHLQSVGLPTQFRSPIKGIACVSTCLTFNVHVLDAPSFPIYNACNYVHMYMTCSTCIYACLHAHFRTDEMEVGNEYSGEQSLLYLM